MRSLLVERAAGRDGAGEHRTRDGERALHLHAALALTAGLRRLPRGCRALQLRELRGVARRAIHRQQQQLRADDPHDRSDEPERERVSGPHPHHRRDRQRGDADPGDPRTPAHHDDRHERADAAEVPGGERRGARLRARRRPRSHSGRGTRRRARARAAHDGRSGPGPAVSGRRATTPRPPVEAVRRGLPEDAEPGRDEVQAERRDDDQRLRDGRRPPQSARGEVGGEGDAEPDEDAPDADHGAPSRHSSRTVVPSPVRLDRARAADRRHTREDRGADAEPVVAARPRGRSPRRCRARRSARAPGRRCRRRRPRVPTPPACWAALATACVAASTRARATRPGIDGRVARRSSARPRTSTPSSCAARSISSAMARGLASARRCPLRESCSVLARRVRASRAMPTASVRSRGVCGALRGDERREDAVVHERGDGDALLLGGIRRGRLRVGLDGTRAGLVDVRRDRAEDPPEGEEHAAEDQRERDVEGDREPEVAREAALDEPHDAEQERDERGPDDLQAAAGRRARRRASRR